jgi:hypothetical protein
MFWNDPTLYSTTHPYREFGTIPYPFINPYIPKFVPPTFGALPYDFRFDPRMFVQPWLQTPSFPPFMQPYNFPFVQPPQGFTPWMNLPLQQFQPQFQPYNFPFMQPPVQQFQRPFAY